MKELSVRFRTRTVEDLTSLYDSSKLNLNPGFQRKSVWTTNDRKKLISSVLANLLIPSIFLYMRSDDNGLVYDVLDGKQRLEAILKFQNIRGIRGDKFQAKITKRDSDGQETEEFVTWTDLKRLKLDTQLCAYELQTVEVQGDLSQIINLFVLINSTGRSLTSAEKRNAKFYNSAFLKEVGKLAERSQAFFLRNQLLSRAQMERMKHIELLSELTVSIMSGGLIDKKKALDHAIAGKKTTDRDLKSATQQVFRLLRLVEQVFPSLKETRFRNAADFYSLGMWLWKVDANGAILSRRDLNAQASELLKRLDIGIARVRQQNRRSEGASVDQRVFVDYLMSVQSDTDSLAQRQRRERYLDNLFHNIFEQKDARRLFSPEQRRIIWHTDEKKECSGCGDSLTWENFTVDHVLAHSRGGRTLLENASLMCRRCNSAKGKRVGRRLQSRFAIS